MDRIKIFTDGACSGNPGPGGACAIVISPSGKTVFIESYKKTTNNRMELRAVILGLENASENKPTIIFTDSKYISDAINQHWLSRWMKNGWLLSNKKPVKNEDLWRRLAILLEKRDIIFQWIEGHSGIAENEECDYIAQKALQNPTLIDEGYESCSNPLGI